MMDFLLQYGLFLAKTLTIIVGILIVISALLSLRLKEKADEGNFIITNINDKFEEISQSFQSETLPKAEWKKWQKEQKRLAKEKYKSEDFSFRRLFIMRFEGDIRASQVKCLREVISAIITIAAPEDEVLLVLESPGGMVHGYGLAASQLNRLREYGLHLTVAIDKCAASGGYMMACVANKILAAPFALVGSIGVVGQLPNFHRLLEKNHIDYELITAGEYKRTLTVFGENTEKGREKFKEEIEQTHALFKEYITMYRPQIDIQQVATGEHWYATTAMQYHLVDEIKTSDDFILSKLASHQLFEVSYKEKQKLSERITQGIALTLEKSVLKILGMFPSLFR